MAKTNKNTAHLPLVVMGYALFCLLVVGVLASTVIPFGALLFSPTALKNNVLVILISLSIGAVLPALLGYLIGDQSVKAKNKLSHHFNGVLFGLLAFWVMMIFSVAVTLPWEQLTSDPIARIAMVNLLPSIAAAIVAIIVAVGHVRSTKAKQDVLSYKPFSVVLIACIGALPIWTLGYNIVTNTLNIGSFVAPLAIVALGLVSYFTLRSFKAPLYDKVVWAAVSVSVFYVTMYVSTTMVSLVSDFFLWQPSAEVYSILGWVGAALAVIGWGVYWAKQVKVLRTK